MNIKQAVDRAIAQLASAQSPSITDSANLDARLLVCQACDIEQTQLIAHPEQELTPKQEKLFNANLERRTKGEPLAYITGTKEFWSLDFAVNKNVLIPRPETELLVELAIKYASTLTSPNILDLGTGSGAIAISLATELYKSNANIVATDISNQALKVASQNANTHKTNISFIKSDWYEEFTNEKFNLIICNPPYISNDDPHLNSQVKKYEPDSALISKDNGTHDLMLVISSAKKHLLPNGKLMVEHGFLQQQKVKSLFSKYAFDSITTYKDLSSNDRVTCGEFLEN